MSNARRRSAQQHQIGELFTFVLFAIFLMLSLLIVVIGADGYRRVVSTGDSVGGMRTALGYVAGKVRSEAATDGMRIEEIDGVNALVLTELYEDYILETYIYYKDGALYEAYLAADQMEFDPEFGSRLTEIDQFTFSMDENGLLALTAMAEDGRMQTLHLGSRTTEGVAAQ